MFQRSYQTVCRDCYGCAEGSMDDDSTTTYLVQARIKMLAF